MKRFLFFWAVALGASVSTLEAGAQGTAFTYQGRLGNNGSIATGSYDLQFTLFSGPTGGSPLAGPVQTAVTLSNGLFTAVLDFGASVLNGNPRWLEIAARTNGVVAFMTLTPRQLLTSAPYAIRAQSAASAATAATAGTLTGNLAATQIVGVIAPTNFGPGTITGTNLANGSVASSNLAFGAALGNLADGAQSPIAPGAVILSDTESSSLVNAGYVRIGATQAADTWKQRTDGPGQRQGHLALWTGSEMIVWGGTYFHQSYPDGARYNPATDSWIPIPSTTNLINGPGQSAVWTGAHLIVFGGGGAGPVSNNKGARYSFSTGIWTPTSPSGAPGPRQFHTAIWTGSQMILWGGVNTAGNIELNNGARYDPVPDTWSPMSLANAPVGRHGHSAVWTGTQMIVWGGDTTGYGNYTSEGGRYAPATDTWTATATNGAPPSRFGHAAFWIGSEMIVLGGFRAEGGRYNPANDTWKPTATIGAPGLRTYFSSVWTGNDIIIWGGETQSGNELNDGARYTPLTDAWTPIYDTDGAPGTLAYYGYRIGRYNHSAVWTGTQMIMYGGYGYVYNGGYFLTHTELNDVWSYPALGAVRYVYQKQ